MPPRVIRPAQCGPEETRYIDRDIKIVGLLGVKSPVGIQMRGDEESRLTLERTRQQQRVYGGGGRWRKSK